MQRLGDADLTQLSLARQGGADHDPLVQWNAVAGAHVPIASLSPKGLRLCSPFAASVSDYTQAFGP